MTPPEQKPTRRRLQLSLRTLLATMILTALMLGIWLARVRDQVRRVATIRAAGGEVHYDYDLHPPGMTHGWPTELHVSVSHVSTPRSWLASMFSQDWMDAAWHRAAYVLVDSKQLSNDCLQEIAGLNGLQYFTVVYHYNDNDSRPTAVERGLTDDDFAVLSQATGLHSLTIQGHRIGDDALACFARLPELRQLDLADADVTEAGVAQLEHAPKLHGLLIRNTRPLCAALDRLYQAKSAKPVERYFEIDDASYHGCPNRWPTVKLSREAAALQAARRRLKEEAAE
ncbi:MAG TPA: hypothetical protein VGE52_03870 [Pirellulales bacterium]